MQPAGATSSPAPIAEKNRPGFEIAESALPRVAGLFTKFGFKRLEAVSSQLYRPTLPAECYRKDTAFLSVSFEDLNALKLTRRYHQTWPENPKFTSVRHLWENHLVG